MLAKENIKRNHQTEWPGKRQLWFNIILL